LSQNDATNRARANAEMPPDDIEHDHSQLLRGEKAGGLAGLNLLYALWGRPKTITFSIFLAVLVPLAAWWFDLHPFAD
jgi:hypothetical protein